MLLGSLNSLDGSHLKSWRLLRALLAIYWQRQRQDNGVRKKSHCHSVRELRQRSNWYAYGYTYRTAKLIIAKTNCLSETLFQQAIASSKALDAHFKQTGKPIGPLHGLPISLKDNFNVIGVDSTVGFVSWVGHPAVYNATLVDILQDAGAVLYVKTNVPTAMMIAETVNNVFGRTLNPRNRKLTSGGSSGGESALIAFGGSPLGVGTDIGTLLEKWKNILLIKYRWFIANPCCHDWYFHATPILRSISYVEVQKWSCWTRGSPIGQRTNVTTFTRSIHICKSRG